MKILEQERPSSFHTSTLQTYRELLRLGLQYDRAQKTYSAEDLDPASMDSVLELLSKILHDKACFEQTTEAAGNTAGQPRPAWFAANNYPCQECRYYELCETRDLPLSCICGKCLEEGKTLP